ncbi:MAG: ABC transporter ATP-binding protein [Nocardiopsaceae bacterium]|nr:ABC transporter ATP-binding protein [Nocardiopsaceae bacterium]
MNALWTQRRRRAPRATRSVESGVEGSGVESPALVELDGVSHRFRARDRPAVDGVSLRVADGEIVAVVGESGCGKSTLGRIGCGIIEPSGGTVRFRGTDVSGMTGREAIGFRRCVQLVHQDPFASLNPGLPLRTTLGYAPMYHKIVSRRELDDFLLDTLRRVGLDASPEFLDRYPHQLSGGQRQRVAIARAASLNPRLIVADEAVSMLDVSMRVSVLDLMLGFREDAGMAYVFISHDLGVVRYFAGDGRIVVMFYGVIVEEGATEDVITRPGHPYTCSLLQSLPVPDPRRARSRREDRAAALFTPAGDAGNVGDAGDGGCVFRRRCPLATDQCATAPPASDLGGNHRAACWFPDKVAELSASVLGAAD